jgi:hypothetical protein
MGPKPVKLGGQIALDSRDGHGDDAIAAGFQPVLPRGAVMGDHFGLVRVEQLDCEPVHKRDKIRNVAADRGLPLELAGEAAIGSQGLPQQALRIGRVSPQQPRQPAHGRAFRWQRSLPVLGQ